MKRLQLENADQKAQALHPYLAASLRPTLKTSMGPWCLLPIVYWKEPCIPVLQAGPPTAQVLGR